MAALTVRVSAGFYVRSLAHDLGAVLGTGAHLSALRRTQAGAFALDRTPSSWERSAGGEPRRSAALLPLERLLPHLPAVPWLRRGRRRVPGTAKTCRRPLPAAAAAPRPPVRLLDADGRLVGIAEPASTSRGGRPRPAFLQPVVILG